MLTYEFLSFKLWPKYAHDIVVGTVNRTHKEHRTRRRCCGARRTIRCGTSSLPFKDMKIRFDRFDNNIHNALLCECISYGHKCDFRIDLAMHLTMHLVLWHTQLMVIVIAHAATGWIFAHSVFVCKTTDRHLACRVWCNLHGFNLRVVSGPGQTARTAGSSPNCCVVGAHRNS